MSSSLWPALILLLRPSFADNLSERREQQVMLVLSVASLCSLVQFPFAAPIYFCYFAPLTVLAAAALLATQKRAPGRYLLVSLLGFYLLYAALRVGPSFVYATMDVGSSPKTRVLGLPRAAGLRVPVDKAPPYEQIIPLVKEHAGGPFLLALPECTELYFLSELRNPTTNDGNIQRDELLENVARDQLKEVVINQRPVFAASRVPEDLEEQLAAEFPNSIMIGKYLIRWRR